MHSYIPSPYTYITSLPIIILTSYPIGDVWYQALNDTNQHKLIETPCMDTYIQYHMTQG